MRNTLTKPKAFAMAAAALLAGCASLGSAGHSTASASGGANDPGQRLSVSALQQMSLRHSGGAGSLTSHNWSGYATLNQAMNNATAFTGVHARWVEPQATCTAPNAWAGFWVGLDGWKNNNVEQGGTSLRCVNGVPQHHLWWEMYPYNQVQEGPAINAGDVIDASVTYSSSTGQFHILVQDLTGGQSINRYVACQSGQEQCVRSSAEVISEAIGSSSGGAPDNTFFVPNYGSLTYTNVTVTDTAGHTGTLTDSAWNAERIDEVSSGGQTRQTTSATNGSTFSTQFVHR